MQVSQFELVYKPQSPQGPADTVLQGYFLKITNLEDFDLFFRIEFVTSPISNTDRTLFDNAVPFVDTPDTNNSEGNYALIGQADSKRFRLNPLVPVPACGTALVALLPSDPFLMPTPANFETRGFVKISLPPVFRRLEGSQFPIFIQQAQAAEPVKVLLTPQSRGTYLEQGTGEIKGQTQSTLPLAEGRSQYHVPPEPPFFFPELEGAFNTTLFNIQPEDFTPDLLAALMAQVEHSEMDLRKFNAQVKKMGVGLALERRKG